MESKAIGIRAISAAMEEFMQTFAEFRVANDQRLEEIEKRSGAD